MTSFKNILTVSAYEAKVLYRNWFFRIIAIAGIGFITLFDLLQMSDLDDPIWQALANGWILPLATLILICVPQSAAVIFLATGLVKKDKKLDTNEVFFVRPISNLDYVFGKALALFKLFILLNALLLSIGFIVGATAATTTINPVAFLIYPVLTSVPSIVFATGISFLLVTVIRNQPISIVLLIGLTVVQLIYFFDGLSNIPDYIAFRLPILASEMTGFVDIEFAAWHRAFYFLAGIACLFATAYLLDRLAGNQVAHKATGMIGIALFVVSAFIMAQLWEMRQAPITLRQALIEVNGRWAEVPNADIVSNQIDLTWQGDAIACTSEMTVRNNGNATLDSIYFSLNPDLVVDEVLVNDQQKPFTRDLQVVSISQGMRVVPGQELKVVLKYHGGINESVAHLEVDQERYESANEYLAFVLKKKYAFLEDDYVLLTHDVLWYPTSEVGFNRKSASTQNRSFVDFRLHVHAPNGMTPVSQGEMTLEDGVYQFKPEYPLPQLSLAIGQYTRKEIEVGGVTYSVVHHPNNDFFQKHLNLLADTLSYLITDIINEYEDAQGLSYPFRRLQFVEVPLHFTAYNKIYESHQAFIQPETVYVPEEGGKIRQFDFRRQMATMNKQAAKANQVLTEKQKQANIFKDLVQRVFTKQGGLTWVYEGQKADNPDYCLFPNYYDFNFSISSNDWPLLNRSIANYLRTDKQTQNDYSREIDGISFTEACNDLMREASLTEIITKEKFNKVNKSITLKSKYLFSYLAHIVGEHELKSFLQQWVNTHQHQVTPYRDFRDAIISRFGVDVDPLIHSVFSEKSQPAFEILDVQKYEVTDGDRIRYQVLLKARNTGDSDGVIEIKFNPENTSDDDYYYGYSEINPDMPEEIPGTLSVIKRGESKLLGFVLDEKPTMVSINTLVSQNIPSIINIPLGKMSTQNSGSLFHGERILEDGRESANYEVIVDNEDPGFTNFSPIKPTVMSAWLESYKGANRKYHGTWSSSVSAWRATTGSEFYGRIIRSASFTRSGTGRKTATWHPSLKEEGFYDVYVYLRGKNQNAFVGNSGEGAQFTYHYIVENADGTDDIHFNLGEAEPGWNYLGSYYFDTTRGSVSLTDECRLRNVYADAVKWVKQ